MSEIPQSLIYKTTMPAGFPSSLKLVEFTPINNSGQWLPKDKIRWEIRSNGFLDPYTTRLNFQVECDDLSDDEIRRLDGSAHSFFSEMTITCRGVIIERLQEYDTFSQIMHDLNWSSYDRRVKAHEGHGVGDLTCGEFANRQNAFSINHQHPRQYKRGSCYDPTFAEHDPDVGPSIPSGVDQGILAEGSAIFTTTVQGYFDKLLNGSNLSSTPNQIVNVGVSPTQQFQLTPISPVTDVLDENKNCMRNLLQNLTDFSLNSVKGALTTMPTTGDNRARGNLPHNLILNYEVPFMDGEHNAATFTTNQQIYYNKCGLCFDKLKKSWKIVGTDERTSWSGYPKQIQSGTPGNNFYKIIDIRMGTTDDLTNFYAANVSFRFFTTMLLKDGIGLNRLRYFTDVTFPSLIVHDSLNYQQREWARNFIHYTRNNIQNTKNTFNLLNNGYFQTQQWTLNEKNNHEAYECAPDGRNSKFYHQRKITKAYQEMGGTQKLDIEYSQDGYSEPFNPLFCNGGDEIYFAGKDVSVKRLENGSVINENGRSYLSFSVPLLSALFGVLMPQEQYKFIPLNIFEDLVIELTLNQYALFSSGYKSKILTGNRLQNEVYDNRGIVSSNEYQVSQNTRNYKITKIVMLADLLSFTPSIERIVNDQWTSESGIMFQTYMWAMGPNYTFQTTASVGGAHQINLNFNSLKLAMWRFYPLDYERFTFCRKHFSLSHNLRSFKFQFGQDYLPIDGIRGNAGTPFGTKNERDSSNKEFFNNMLEAFGKLHDVKGNMLINPFNYSLNDRCYDPTMRGPYYIAQTQNQNLGPAEQYIQSGFNYEQPTTYEKVATGITGPTRNYKENHLVVYNGHTALQLPGFHECRVIGKALFALNFETLDRQFQVLSGLNTYNFKPFNVIFEVDNNTDYHFKRESRLFMFFQYDAVIVFKAGQSPQVIGRA